MLSNEQRQRLQEIDEQIKLLQLEKAQINPFANLKQLSNKMFGEEWSENYILKQCPTLKHSHGKGYDFYSQKLGKIELKSSRLPCKQITFNQLHPNDCDYFLFAIYDTEEANVYLCLISSQQLVKQCKYTAQHDRNNNASCFSMTTTQHNKAVLQQYQIPSFEELRKLI